MNGNIDWALITTIILAIGGGVATIAIKILWASFNTLRDNHIQLARDHNLLALKLSDEYVRTSTMEKIDVKFEKLFARLEEIAELLHSKADRRGNLPHEG